MAFSKEILETIFLNQTSFIYLLDKELKVTFVSQPLLTYMGKTNDELIGKSIADIGYDAKTVATLDKLFHQALKGDVVSGEDLFTSIKGVDTYFEYTFAPVKDKDGSIVAISAVCRDITDRKKMELELKNYVVELKKERELRESFITAMTHDLRTPLTAAKLSAQIIQRHPQDGKAISKFSARIIENVERTDTMIRDLLDSLRFKAGEGIMLNIQQHVMNAIIESVVEDIATVQGDRFKVEMSEMVKGHWDSIGIRRVLENLLTNALKYGASDKPITIKLFRDGDLDCISVNNDGETLTQEELSNLFVPFKRLKNAQESGQKGWGIGLTLVLGITEAHGGTVTVESLPTKGTTFTIKLPRHTI
jgi:PAS domain S-box-containing protein